MGLSGIGQGHRLIPGHDPVSCLQVLQCGRAARITDSLGITVQIDQQSAVVCRDDQAAVLPLCDLLHHMVLGAGDILRDIPDHRIGCGLGRKGAGGNGAVEHIDALPLLQVRGI